MSATARQATAWGREPLRVRLVVLFVTLLLVAIAAVSTLALTMLRSALVASVDDQLTKAAQSLVVESVNAQTSGNPLVPTEYAVIIADTTGATLLSYSTNGAYPRLDALDLESVTDRGATPFTVGSQDGSGSWRVTVRPATSRGGTIEGTAAIALPLDSVDATMRWMAGALMAVGAGVLLVAAVLTHAVVRQSLRPLRRIETTAAKIADGDLSQRIEPLPPSTEVGSLAQSLNTMLADLEEAFDARREGEERLQRFVGDASHELRTPLATMRGYTELYRLGGIPQDSVPEVMGRIEESATRMSALVADLLALTRLDQSAPLSPEAIPVPDLLVALAEDARALDATRVVAVQAAPGLQVQADPVLLHQILTNLIGNAVAYTAEGSPIELVASTASLAPGSDAARDEGGDGTEASGHDGGNGPAGPAGTAGTAGEAEGAREVAAIEVRDHGGGIPAQDRERVFERFARLDTGRSRDAGGSGLGLAIARESARAMGGEVTCVETPGGGATMRLVLPLA